MHAHRSGIAAPPSCDRASRHYLPDPSTAMHDRCCAAHSGHHRGAGHCGWVRPACVPLPSLASSCPPGPSCKTTRRFPVRAGWKCGKMSQSFFVLAVSLFFYISTHEESLVCSRRRQDGACRLRAAHHACVLWRRMSTYNCCRIPVCATAALCVREVTESRCLCCFASRPRWTPPRSSKS